MSDANVLVKMNCGKHYGAVAGPCKKCAYFATEDAATRQHNGTPWAAIYGRVVNCPFPGAPQVPAPKRGRNPRT